MNVRDISPTPSHTETFSAYTPQRVLLRISSRVFVKFLADVLRENIGFVLN
jgi:hypothetical protein